MAKIPAHSLNNCQKQALELLQSSENIFLTGVAGSGKSYLIQHFLNLAGESQKTLPVLASTGAAAVLIGGRTFHSFFGLGILQGGVAATIDRASQNKSTARRIRKAKTVVVDEISMLSGECLQAAEAICCTVRENNEPWGGIRMIAVGDFAQLPPVPNRQTSYRDWAFSDPVWERSAFKTVSLKTIVRTQDTDFLDVLNDVRIGKVTERVTKFLNARVVTDQDELESFVGTKLFPHRATAENDNLRQLCQIEGEVKILKTVYSGRDAAVEALQKYCPIAPLLQIKVGAFVMIRQNDPIGRWVNGSLGHVQTIEPEKIYIKLLDRKLVGIEKTSFNLMDAEGREIASATNFPLNLAYASTIHKSQGVTLDKAVVDLRQIWEPGQAYVALSRVKSASGLKLTGWEAKSIRIDPKVEAFYSGT